MNQLIGQGISANNAQHFVWHLCLSYGPKENIHEVLSFYDCYELKQTPTVE